MPSTRALSLRKLPATTVHLRLFLLAPILVCTSCGYLFEESKATDEAGTSIDGALTADAQAGADPSIGELFGSHGCNHVYGIQHAGSEPIIRLDLTGSAPGTVEFTKITDQPGGDRPGSGERRSSPPQTGRYSPSRTGAPPRHAR